MQMKNIAAITIDTIPSITARTMKASITNSWLIKVGDEKALKLSCLCLLAH